MPKSLLTETERYRLIHRIPESDDSDKERFKNTIYNNDAIVRNKIKTWLTESDDVLFALKHLQTRKLKRSISDDEIFKLFHVALTFLNEFDFRPVDETNDDYRHVVVEVMGLNRPNEIWLRPATSEEINRNIELRQIASNLKRFVSRKELLDQLDRMYADMYKAKKSD
jgi:hypothetical protein